MKCHRQLLDKKTIYSLTICKYFDSISYIIIKKINLKAYNDKIEGKNVKRVILNFFFFYSFTKNNSINATIKIQTIIFEQPSKCFYCNAEEFLDKIRRFKEFERGDIIYLGNKNKIFRLLSSIPIMGNRRSNIINNLKPCFYVMNKKYCCFKYTPWAWKNVRWHVLKELD